MTLFRHAPCAVLALAFLSLAACTQPLSVNAPGGGGSITVTFPASRALDVAFAQANSNLYELIAYEQTGNNTKGHVYYTVAASGSGGTLSGVAPGTYKVLVLTGYKYFNGTPGTSSPEAFLLGTGYATDVTVAGNANTPVSITLINTTLTITAPAEVAVSTTFDVTFAGNTGAPMVAPVNLSNFNHSSNSAAVTRAQAWSVTANFTAPAATGTSSYYPIFGSSAFGLNDSSNGYSYSVLSQLESNTAPQWLFPTKANGTWSPFAAQVPDEAVVAFFSPGIVANVVWGAGQ